MAQTGDLGHVLDLAAHEQALEMDRQRHQARDVALFDWLLGFGSAAFDQRLLPRFSRLKFWLNLASVITIVILIWAHRWHIKAKEHKQVGWQRTLKNSLALIAIIYLIIGGVAKIIS